MSAAFPVVVFHTSDGELDVTWKKQFSLECPYAVSCTSQEREGFRLHFLLAFLSKLVFFLPCLFSDIFFYLKPENIINMSTKFFDVS